MSEPHWWAIYGAFKPWRECPTRPDPGEVLQIFLEKNTIEQEEYVSYLSHLLDLQKSMVYNVLNGLGLDSITRCRILVHALKIPPPLLGLDAKYFPIEQHADWWQEAGFPFHAEASGYPVMSEVVAYLRLQMTKREDDGRVKVWSQEDLGDATGLKKETVYRMEHDQNPFVLESMSRRAIVALALSTRAEDSDGTILRLFGLDPQAYGASVSTSVPVPELLFLPEHVTDEVLQDYQQKLAIFWTLYYTEDEPHLVEDANACLKQLEALHLKAENLSQRVHLFALRCRFHEVIGAYAREQMQQEHILVHTRMAVELAEEARSLCKRHHTFGVLTSELLAAALLWCADASCDCEEYTPARSEIDRALQFLPEVQDPPLKMRLLAQAGLIHAYTAQSEMDRALVLSYFNLASQLNASNQLCKDDASADDHFLWAEAGLLHLYRALALCAPNMKGMTKESVHDLLEEAQRFTPAELVRRHVQILVGLAQVSASAGDYRQAILLALDALEKSRQIHSVLNHHRLEELYQHLLNTDCRGQPSLVYLGIKLHRWDYDRD